MALKKSCLVLSRAFCDSTRALRRQPCCVLHYTSAKQSVQQSEQLSSVEREPSLPSESAGENGGSAGHKRKVSLSLPTVYLPQKLQAALEKTLESYSPKALAADGQALSEFLLSRKVPTKQEGKKTANNKPSQLNPWMEDKGVKRSRSFHQHFKYGRREGVAYAASRLPAVYGATLRVLTEVARRDKHFRPETLLDFGSGLGTTVWAAKQLWAESLYECQCVDVSSEMGELARALRVGGVTTDESHPPNEELTGVHFRQYLPLSNKVQYDMVVGAYTLGDISSVKLRRMFLAALWRKTKDYLVLLEHGNWTGFNVITEARDMILQAAQSWTKYEDETAAELEGHVFAPCPHDMECPLAQSLKSTCHFGQRVQLALSERNGPLKHKGFRLENFSFVVLKKGPRTHSDDEGARVLRPTRKRTRHILCELCTQQGEVREMVFTKSKHRDIYRECRQSKWGDLLTTYTQQQQT